MGLHGLELVLELGNKDLIESWVLLLQILSSHWIHHNLARLFIAIIHCLQHDLFLDRIELQLCLLKQYIGLIHRLLTQQQLLTRFGNVIIKNSFVFVLFPHSDV